MLLLLSLIAPVLPAESIFPLGWRGVPFGPDSVLATPPGTSCVAAPERGVYWRCVEPIGEYSYSVSYMGEEDLFTGVYVQCTGYLACTHLYTVLTAAWAPTLFTPKYKGATDGNWFRANNVGSYSYNQYSQTGSAIISDLTVYSQIEAVKKARASQAAGGL